MNVYNVLLDVDIKTKNPECVPINWRDQKNKGLRPFLKRGLLAHGYRLEPLPDIDDMGIPPENLRYDPKEYIYPIEFLGSLKAYFKMGRNYLAEVNASPEQVTITIYSHALEKDVGKRLLKALESIIRNFKEKVVEKEDTWNRAEKIFLIEEKLEDIVRKTF
jgi:hypothetical protein